MIGGLNGCNTRDDACSRGDCGISATNSIARRLTWCGLTRGCRAPCAARHPGHISHVHGAAGPRTGLPKGAQRGMVDVCNTTPACVGRTRSSARVLRALGIVLTAPLVAHERSGVEWLRYYVRRLCRLYVPVWGSLLVAALCCMIVPRQNLSGGTWLVGHPNPTLPQMMRDALLLLGTSSVNSPLWSLRWEVWFSLLLPMMFLVLRLVRVDRWPLLAVLVLALVSAIGHTPTIQVLVSSSTVAGSLEYLSVFSIGMIIALSGARVGQLRERVAQAGRGWRVGWLVVGLVFATSPTYVGTHPAARVSFGLHVATVVGVTMIVLSALVAPGVVRILESRLLHYAGIRSFSVYLVHEPILVSVAILVHARGFWPWVVIAPGAIALALLVAEGFYRVVERPATRLSRTLAVRGISKSGAC